MNIKLKNKTAPRKQFSKSYRELHEARIETIQAHHRAFHSKILPLETKQVMLEKLAEAMQEMGHYSPNTKGKDLRFAIIRKCFRAMEAEDESYQDKWTLYCDEIGFSIFSCKFK